MISRDNLLKKTIPTFVKPRSDGRLIKKFIKKKKQALTLLHNFISLYKINIGII